MRELCAEDREMSLLQKLDGTLTIELTSADIAGTLEFLCGKGIFLQDVSYLDELTVRFCIPRTSYRQLSSLLDRRGQSFRVISRAGLYWRFRAWIHRPVLTIGIVFFLFLTIFLPNRVLFVKIQGNTGIPTEEILDVASDLGVKIGASRRFVRSEQVKNGLLSALEELEWAGVNTKGCVAIISVRERSAEEPMVSQGFCDVVAARDGVVLNCDVIKGVPRCVPGQAVKTGEVLISGTLEQGSVAVSIAADGEVFAYTNRDLSVIYDPCVRKRGAITDEKQKFSLLIGKKLINFFKGSGISGGTCVKMYSKYVLTLPGGFCLPVALVKYRLVSCEMTVEQKEKSRAKELLSAFSDRYIRDRMIAGRIVSMAEEIRLLGNVYQQTGTYACIEMIGRVKQEQIGAYHGKTD